MKLKSIRDKTFVHIDKEGVFDPGKYYEGAPGLTDLPTAGGLARNPEQPRRYTSHAHSTRCFERAGKWIVAARIVRQDFPNERASR